MATKMSLVEEECRLSIAHAYNEWLWTYDREGHFSVQAYKLGLGFTLLDYERALGLALPFEERGAYS